MGTGRTLVVATGGGPTAEAEKVARCLSVPERTDIAPGAVW